MLRDPTLHLRHTAFLVCRSRPLPSILTVFGAHVLINCLCRSTRPDASAASLRHARRARRSSTSRRNATTYVSPSSTSSILLEPGESVANCLIYNNSPRRPRHALPTTFPSTLHDRSSLVQRPPATSLPPKHASSTRQLPLPSTTWWLAAELPDAASRHARVPTTTDARPAAVAAAAARAERDKPEPSARHIWRARCTWRSRDSWVPSSSWSPGPVELRTAAWHCTSGQQRCRGWAAFGASAWVGREAMKPRSIDTYVFCFVSAISCPLRSGVRCIVLMLCLCYVALCALQ